MIIGYSLSGCVKDIVRYNIDTSNLFLITSTRFADFERFKEAIKNYKENSWSEDYEKCEQIAIKLWEEGKIYQPRVHGLDAPGSADGRWFDESGNKLVFSLKRDSMSFVKDTSKFSTKSIR